MPQFSRQLATSRFSLISLLGESQGSLGSASDTLRTTFLRWAGSSKAEQSLQGWRREGKGQAQLGKFRGDSGGPPGFRVSG